MRSLAIKKFWNKFFYSKTVFVLIVLLSLLVSYKTVFVFIKYKELKDKKTITENNKLDLENELKDKKDKYEFLQTERGKDELLKREYGLSKIHEKEIIVYKKDDAVLQSINNIDTETGFLYKAKFFIKNYTNIDF